MALSQTQLNLNSSKVFYRGCIIWGIAAMFYFFDNLLNVSPSAMKPQLSEAWSLSAAELGILSSFYLWPYAIMQIPAGLMMDKIGPRRILAVASLFCALGSFLFGSADTLYLAIFGRVCIGIGASFAVVGCTKIASVWFLPSKFALFMGFMVAIGMLGGAFGLATVNYIISSYGWRESMHSATYVALFISTMMWILIRDVPSKTGKVQQLDILQSLREVILSKQAWIASIYAGLMFIPTLAFGALWGIPYLVEAHNFDQDTSGFLASLIFIGWVFGGPIYGWVSDKILLRNPPMYFANITTLIVSIVIIYCVGLPKWLIGGLMFSLGFFSSGFIIAFAVTRESNRPEVSGTAIGFINMLNTLSGALFQWIIGLLLDMMGGNVISGTKVFSLHDYQKALLTLPISLVISLIVLFKLKETYCRPQTV